MLENNEPISKQYVEELPLDQQNFFKYTLPKVIKQAQAEWTAEGGCKDNGDATIPCGICGTPNRYIYYITNQISGNSINVGSECIKKFFDDIKEKLTRGKSFDSAHRYYAEQARKIRRLDIFNQSFPGADKMLEGWKHKLENVPLMLPYELEKEYMDNYYQGRDLIKAFQDRTKPDSYIIDKFRLVIQNEKKVWEKIEQYVAKNKGNLFAQQKKLVTG